LSRLDSGWSPNSLQAPAPQPDLVLVCFGGNDGRRAGLRATQFRDTCEEAVERIHRATRSSAVVLLLRSFAVLLQTELRKQQIGAEVVTAGIGGERTDQALKRLDRAVLALKPRIVLVLYGTNDSVVDRAQKEPRLSDEQSRDNMKELVTAVRKGGAQVSVMTPPRPGEKAAPNGVGENPDVRLEGYVEVYRALAREMKIGLVAHFAYWMKAAVSVSWLAPLATSSVCLLGEQQRQSNGHRTAIVPPIRRIRVEISRWQQKEELPQPPME
jgi:lysophospholipase L1-like esterase